MSWVQLRIAARPASSEVLEDALLAAGALAVTYEDAANQPVLEPAVGETPLWDRLRLTALFAADVDMKAITDRLAPLLAETGETRWEILEDRDWAREWMRHYRPMRFGDRLWVCPGWLTPPDPTAVNLLLDPGLAFGTGTHPTTALCLEALAGMELSGARVADYGCGSGILAVAAGLLGAKAVLAVDNDPQALTATAGNSRRNGLPGELVTRALPGAWERGPWAGRCELVVANILAGPLLALRDTLAGLMAPGATLLLSGLIEEQGATLIDGYADLIALEVAGRRDGWLCLRGVRPA